MKILSGQRYDPFSGQLRGIGQNRTDSTRMSMTLGYHSVDELSDVENPKRILVRGKRPYDGNDARN